MIYTTGGYVLENILMCHRQVQVDINRDHNHFCFVFKYSALGNTEVKAAIVNSNHAVYHNPGYCCTFGGGHNIFISDSSNTNSNSSSYCSIVSLTVTHQVSLLTTIGLLDNETFRYKILKCLDIKPDMYI